MFVRFSLSLIVALMAGSSATAVAAYRDFDESIDCAKVATQGGLQFDRSQCQGRAVNETEFQLTRVYGQLRTALKNDKQGETTLVLAQRAWIAWRDKEADLCAQLEQGYGTTGSAYGEIFGACKQRLNQERVTYLRSLLRK